MGSSAILLAALVGPASCGQAPPAPMGHTLEGPVPVSATWAPSFEEVYRSGVSFQDFLEKASRRREMWERHYYDGEIEEEALSKASALTGTWRILAIAEDWCSDSVNTVPFLAILADAVPAIELRVINSEVGEDIMNAHLTPDGRAATPTVIVLGLHYEEVGCWVERPGELQAWARENRADLGEEFMPRKMAWYREDAGRSTVAEILAVIEAADAGRTVCEKG